MNYSGHFAQALVNNGLDAMFGVLGDANMYLGDSYTRCAGTQYIAAAHEGGAVLMAAGYAGVTGKVGAATVTHGAITNAVSALFEASRAALPLVLFAGEAARTDRDNLQNLPNREIVAPTGAFYQAARHPDSVYQDVAQAARLAASARRPVVLGIPSDFQRMPCEASPSWSMNVEVGRRAPDRGSLEELAALVAAAHRPVVLAGRGAGTPGAVAALRELAERIGAPVATTLRGKGCFVDEPFDIGVWGTLATPPGLETIVKSDLVLAFGASLSPLTTMRGELMAGKRVVQVDADPTAFGRHYPAELGIVADAELCARELVALLDEAEVPPSAFRTADLERALRDFETEDRMVRVPSGPLHIIDALHRINAICPQDRTISIDAGRFAHEALRVLEVASPDAYLHALNVAQIGMSLSYGIGGAIGVPDRPSVVVIGDGGFMLGGLTEFNTAVRYGLDLVVFVINDGAYGAEYYRFVNEDLDASLTTFDWPDLAAVATSLGGRGLTVTELSDFDQVERELGRRKGPVLVDVRLDRDRIPDPGAH